MVIYLKHVKHGTKVAVSEDEAKADEKQGWQRYQIAALLREPVREPETVVSEPANALVTEEVRRRPGRPKKAA